jgi:hypothetical protein
MKEALLHSNVSPGSLMARQSYAAAQTDGFDPRYQR